MSHYHDKTLKLLGAEVLLDEQPVPQLLQWAQANQVTLPAAYLEWVQLDHQNLLQFLITFSRKSLMGNICLDSTWMTQTTRR
jgi:hypothetical protein